MNSFVEEHNLKSLLTSITQRIKLSEALESSQLLLSFGDFEKQTGKNKMENNFHAKGKKKACDSVTSLKRYFDDSGFALFQELSWFSIQAPLERIEEILGGNPWKVWKQARKILKTLINFLF